MKDTSDGRDPGHDVRESMLDGVDSLSSLDLFFGCGVPGCANAAVSSNLLKEIKNQVSSQEDTYIGYTIISLESFTCCAWRGDAGTVASSSSFSPADSSVPSGRGVSLGSL